MLVCARYRALAKKNHNIRNLLQSTQLSAGHRTQAVPAAPFPHAMSSGSAFGNTLSPVSHASTAANSSSVKANVGATTAA
jgi:hypothetical protein